MSSFLSTIFKIKDRERVPEVVAMATELTKKMSLDKLGFDLTDPANKDIYQSFNIIDSCLCWTAFSKVPKWIDESEIIDVIVHSFPDSEFIYEFYDDGPLVYKEYIKGDYREQLVQRTLDIGVDNPEAFTRLADVLDVQQSYPFFIFPLGELPVSKVEPEIDSIIDRVSKIVPDQKLYCIKVANVDQGDGYFEKGVFEAGKINWQQITWDEYDVVNLTIESIEVKWENRPNSDILKCLFDESYRDEMLALIAKRIAEAEARRRATGHNDDDDLPF